MRTSYFRLSRNNLFFQTNLGQLDCYRDTAFRKYITQRERIDCMQNYVWFGIVKLRLVRVGTGIVWAGLRFSFRSLLVSCFPSDLRPRIQHRKPLCVWMGRTDTVSPSSG